MTCTGWQILFPQGDGPERAIAQRQPEAQPRTPPTILEVWFEVWFVRSAKANGVNNCGWVLNPCPSKHPPIRFNSLFFLA